MEHIPLGFDTTRSFIHLLYWTGETLIGLGETDGSRIVRYEVDPVSATVRLATLVDGVRLARTNGPGLAISADVVTAAVVHQPVESTGESAETVELFWWSIGSDDVTRRVVRPASSIGASILALGGEMPQQTLVLAQSVNGQTWVTAARVRAPGEVEGGNEPIGAYTVVRAAAAWAPSRGTAAIALLEQQELEVLYVCEGAP
ncbi:MAG: hypothetical protein AB7S26_33235 [Sandaracinaceae bacterium]